MIIIILIIKNKENLEHSVVEKEIKPKKKCIYYK